MSLKVFKSNPHVKTAFLHLDPPTHVTVVVAQLDHCMHPPGGAASAPAPSWGDGRLSVHGLGASCDTWSLGRLGVHGLRASDGTWSLGRLRVTPVAVAAEEGAGKASGSSVWGTHIQHEIYAGLEQMELQRRQHCYIFVQTCRMQGYIMLVIYDLNTLILLNMWPNLEYNATF